MDKYVEDKSLMKKIKNYKEYIEKLRGEFGDIDKMPDNKTIQAFIDRNDLYDDWQIVLSDVEQDIRTKILIQKKYDSTQKKNRITSYKEYLEKLRDAFGIPDSMPSYTKIKDFIEEYALLRIWNIDVEDVSEDIQSFIDGKFEEMYSEATSFNKPVVNVTPKSYTKSPVTYHPTYTYYQHAYTPSVKIYVTHSLDYRESDNDILNKQKKSVSKKQIVKQKKKKQKTFFLDGDNHVKEGQKGIERLPKEDAVRAVFSQEGAKKKFDEKYKGLLNVSSILVKPGNQAVDNQIKAEAGQLLKKGNQDITFVSHDKGFEKYKDKKQNTKGGNHISVAKSIKEKSSKKKK